MIKMNMMTVMMKVIKTIDIKSNICVILYEILMFLLFYIINLIGLTKNVNKLIQNAFIVSILI